MFTKEHAEILVSRIRNVINKVNDNPTDTNKEKAIIEIGLTLCQVVRILSRE